MQKTRFIIFGQGRSGSTLLGQLLNSHPQINCENEIFNLKDPYVKNKWLMTYCKRLPYLYVNYRIFNSEENIYGFKLLWYQLENMENYLLKLKNSGWHIIHIDRENLFDQTLSTLVARKNGFWHNYDVDSYYTKKLRIDMYEMREMYRLIEYAKTEVDRLIQSTESLYINYESQLSDPINWQQTCNTIFNYLDVPEAQVESPLKKIMSDKIDDDVFLSIIINNYNYEKFVGAAISSALEAAAMADVQCEVIVVDDGSTDDSMEVIQACEGIQVIVKDNGGQASALNAGFAAAKGKYIHFLDADDLLVKDAVEVIRRVMPGHHMMHFSIEVLDQELGVVSFYNSSRVEPQPKLWTDYFGKGSAWTRPMSCNVFSAELLDKVFPLPEQNWRICADMAVICLGSQFTTYEGSTEVINRYRMHGSNLYFSNMRSTFEMHIYDDQYNFKNSENHRHFFVVGCDVLMRVEDISMYSAVFGNWVRYGDFLLNHANLTEMHRKDINDAMDALIASQDPSFWRVAASALFTKKVNPEHLEAFHRPPGVSRLNPCTVDKTPPQLVYNRAIIAKDLTPYLSGGFLTSDDYAESLVFSLSQASRFTARANALSGIFRLVIAVSPDTVAGAVRCVSSQGQVAETVQVEDELLADIPCNWVVNGVLQFYFVFEKVQVPQAVDLSSFDLSLCGAYIHSIQFDVPLASHFYQPLRIGNSVAAERYLSPIKHLRNSRPVCADGAVPLCRSPAAFGVSLPFAMDAKEWLEFEITNDAETTMVLNVDMWHNDGSGTVEIRDNVSVGAKSTSLFPIPIGFPVFDAVLPEVVLSSVLKPPAGDSIRVSRLRYMHTPRDIVYVPEIGTLSFSDGSLGSLGLSTAWRKHADGIDNNADQISGCEAGTLSFRFHGIEPEYLMLTFSTPDNDNISSTRPTRSSEPVVIMLSVNNQIIETQLDADGSCKVRTCGASEIVLEGWHSWPPGRQLLLMKSQRM